MNEDFDNHCPFPQTGPTRSLATLLLGAACLVAAAAACIAAIGYLNRGAAAPVPAEAASPRPTNWRVHLVESTQNGIVHVVARNQAGTGFVVARNDQYALVLTNRHVIANENTGRPMRTISIRLKDRTRLPTELAALPADEEIDLALLRVKDPGGRLAPLELADFNRDPIGVEVAAIGHPFDLDYTVTDGIISARRDGMMIQHTAQTNPGNSGGPLFNCFFQAIGVNTSFFAGDGMAPLNGGLNFATRADYVTNGEWEFSLDIAGLLDSIRVDGAPEPEPEPEAEPAPEAVEELPAAPPPGNGKLDKQRRLEASEDQAEDTIETETENE